MIIDCHVHVCATTPGHGSVSATLLRSPYFRFIRRRLGLTRENDGRLEKEIENKLVATVAATPELDRVVVLAFDAVHDMEGYFRHDQTHLYVTNDYVAELVSRHQQFLFGASVHPYRKDAREELERCIRLGAVLLKWLPVTQNFNPADPRCNELYEALAHYQLPLLCHTGGERSLPALDLSVADPALLVPALERGVRVIAAHCGTRDRMGAPDYTSTFVRLARDHEHLYGDTAALNLPNRSYAYGILFKEPEVMKKLVHGSDWPILPFPPLRLGWKRAAQLLFRERNWLRRDIRIKQELGFDTAYWNRAAHLLRLPAE